MPDFFTTKLTKNEFNVQLILFKIFNSMEIEKIIPVNQVVRTFLD
jgi:hypothetical protein